MTRFSILPRGAPPQGRSLAGLLLAVLAATCGGDAVPADRTGAAQEDTASPVIRVGENDRVMLEIVAGKTPENSYWNLNGLHGGEGKIRVPLGAEVEVDFRNEDPAMTHSLGITRWADPFPADFAPIEPAFPGAMLNEVGSHVGGLPPEGRSVFRFRASEEGRYAVVCFVPGHAAVGMFIPFEVVEGLAEATVER